MRQSAQSALLCALAALQLVLLASGSRIHTAPTTSSGEALRNLVTDSVTCDVCEEVVKLALVDVGENASTVARVIAFLVDDGCDKLFPKDDHNNTAARACAAVAKTLVDLDPTVSKALEGLAWDIPSGVCSVFVPVCKMPCCDSATPHAPEQLRLSPHAPSDASGVDPTTMAVTWVTLEPTSTSTVQWGDSSGTLTHSSDGHALARTYTYGGWVGAIHTAVMTGLAPRATVYYRVGDSTAASWSPATSFRALPALDDTRSLVVAQVGDMGYGDESNATIARLSALADTLDLFLHTGDIGYADGYQTHWDIFGRKMAPIWSRVPTMTVPGNHEIWGNFTAYKARFSNPAPISTAAAPVPSGAMFYSASIGANLHITMMNTEAEIDWPKMDRAQHTWIEADVAAARTAKPHGWVVAAGHRPLYCSNPGNKIQCAAFADILRVVLEPLFTSPRTFVDLVIQSHEHDFERSWPTKNAVPVQRHYRSPTAPTYVVSGAGGNRESNADPGGKKDWSAWHSKARGYGLATVGNSSLTWQFISAVNNSVLDSFTITK